MTEIYFCFDTEDFTQPLAWEASKQEAQLLEKHGIKGNFNVGNNEEFLQKVIEQMIPYIGYPRSLNAVAALREVSQK